MTQGERSDFIIIIYEGRTCYGYAVSRRIKIIMRCRQTDQGHMPSDRQ